MLTQIDQTTIGTLPCGRIMAIDYGSKRIGIAMSDPSQMLSSSLTMIKNTTRQRVYTELKSVVNQHDVKAIVVGMPVNMNGTSGPKAKESLAFATFLADKHLSMIILWDERWTTKLAQQSLHSLGKSPSKNRDQIDQIAARFLLQNFLDRLAFLRKLENDQTDD